MYGFCLARYISLLMHQGFVRARACLLFAWAVSSPTEPDMLCVLHGFPAVLLPAVSPSPQMP